jgi:hypothetical protein
MRKSKDQGFRSQAGFSFLGAMVAAAFAGVMMGTTAVTYRAWETWGANERVKQRAQSATTLAQQLGAADIAPEMYQEVFGFDDSGQQTDNAVVTGAAETNIKKAEKEGSEQGDSLPLDGSTDDDGHILALVNKGVLPGRAPALGRIISLPGKGKEKPEPETKVTNPLPRYYQAGYAEVNLPGDPPGAGVSETPEGPVFDENGRFYPYDALPSDNPANTMYLVFAGDKLDDLPDKFTGDVGDEGWKGVKNTSVYSHNQWGAYDRLKELFYTRETMPERLAVRAFPPPDNKDQYDPADGFNEIIYSLDNYPVVFRGTERVPGPESELLHFSAAEILAYWLGGRNAPDDHTLTVKQNNQNSLTIMGTGIWGPLAGISNSGNPADNTGGDELWMANWGSDLRLPSSQVGTVEEDGGVILFPAQGVEGASLSFVWGVPSADSGEPAELYELFSTSPKWRFFTADKTNDNYLKITSFTYLEVPASGRQYSNPGWGNPYLAMTAEEETWALRPKVEQLPPPDLVVGE